MRALAGFVSAVLAAGVAYASAVPETAPAVRVFPEVGVETEVELGAPMVLRESVLTATALRLLESARSESLNGTRVVLPAGRYELVRETDRGRYYASPFAGIRALGFNSVAPEGAGLFIPRDPSAPPAAYWRALLGASIVKADGLKVEASDASGFRRELIYGGVSQGTVSLSYREFINDMARPAFSQDLRYDLGAGSEIGFRGARIEIIQAGNVSVKYRVLKPLDAPEVGSPRCGVSCRRSCGGRCPSAGPVRPGFPATGWRDS